MGFVTQQSIVYRSTTSRVLAVVIFVGAAAGMLAAVLAEGAPGALTLAPLLALIAGFGWAAYWRPAVVVHEHGVDLVQVLSTVSVPWESIHAVDTRWALTLQTERGNYAAWAAPAPSRYSLYRVTKDENKALADGAYLDGTIRLGDALSSDSGQAAEIVRRTWQAWRDEVEAETRARREVTTSRRWHVATISAGLALLVLAALPLLVN